MRKLLTVLILLTISACALIGIFFKTKSNFEKNTIKPTQTPFSEKKLFELINEWRMSKNLPIYTKDERLCEIARDRSDDEVFSHTAFYEKYSSFPYKIQENLGRCFDSEQYMLNCWLFSKPHRQTLEKPYTHSCVVCDRQCVQIFSSFER